MGFANILFADERCKIMNENMKIRNFKKTGDLSVLPAFDIDLPVFDIELEEFDIELPEMIVDMPELPTMEELPAFDIDLPDYRLPDLPNLDNLPDLPSEGMARS